jgi:hypothetical protein
MRLNLGKVTCIPRGEYNAEAVYRRLDIVSYNGGSYLVIVDSITGVTPEAGDKYMQLAAAGKNGKDGNDYIITEADKTEIVDNVLAALPKWNGGAY